MRNVMRAHVQAEKHELNAAQRRGEKLLKIAEDAIAFTLERMISTCATSNADVARDPRLPPFPRN